MKFLSFIATLVYSALQPNAPVAVNDMPQVQPVRHQVVATAVMASTSVPVYSTNTSNSSSSDSSTQSSNSSDTKTVSKSTSQPQTTIVYRTAPDAVTSSQLDKKLEELRNSFKSEISQVTAASSPAPAVNYAQMALANRIDQLTNTTINTPTINTPSISGGTFANGNISSATITGTTITGGTISGATIDNPTFTNLGSLSVANSTFGSFNATSTTATSTLSTGGFAIGTSQFVVQQNSGRVAIGTTSPQGLFDITGSSSGTDLTVFDSNRALSIINTNTTNNNANGLDFRTVDTNGLVVSGAKIMGVYTNHTPSSVSADLAFLTRNAGTVGERMRLTAAGLLGVGNSAPSATVDVKGTSGQSNALLNVASSTGSSVFSVGSSGDVTLSHTATSSSAFVINNPSGNNVVTVDDNTPGATDFVLTVASSTGTSIFTVDGSGNGYAAGNFGVGTTSPWATLAVNPAGGLAANQFVVGSSSATSLIVTNSGAVGVATTSPWRTFAVNGTVSMNGLTSSIGAGSVCLSSTKELVYNAGSDACLSSLRATKHDITNLTVSGTDMIDKLQPVSFIYNDGDGRTRYGFIAEDTSAVDQHLVTHTEKGDISGIDDRAIISVAVKAIQEMDIRVKNLETQGTSSSSSSGISFSTVLADLDNLGANITNSVATFVNLVADKLTARKVKVTQGFEMTDQATGDIYCVTISNGDWSKIKGECADPVSNSTATTTDSSNSTASTTTDTTIPIITITGSNPAQIHVGDTYADPGATVTDTDANGNVNNNLGLHFSVDGTSVDSINLDTSTTTTHTIVYSATDGAGNTGYATRTVEVLSQ